MIKRKTENTMEEKNKFIPPTLKITYFDGEYDFIAEGEEALAYRQMKEKEKEQ